MQTGGVDEAYLSPTSLATHYILGTDTSAPKIAILRLRPGKDEIIGNGHAIAGGVHHDASIVHGRVRGIFLSHIA